jgi:hypothetical protein
MYRLILGRHTDTVRSVARSCYIDNAGDREASITDARHRLRETPVGIPTWLIFLAIKLAIQLIIWWSKREIKVPPLKAVAGEPGF